MGTWFSPDEMHEQWQEFASKHWELGEAVSAEKYVRVKDAWDNGYANGHKEIENDRVLQGRQNRRPTKTHRGTKAGAR